MGGGGGGGNLNNTTSNGTFSGTMNGVGIDSNSSGLLLSPSKHEHRKLISESLQLTENPRANRILSYQQSQRPITTSGLMEINQSNPLKVIYSSSSGRMPSTSKNNTRYIPSAPDRILDAPDIINDYCKSQQNFHDV